MYSELIGQKVGILDINNLSKILIVSNTPRFLYTKFLQEQSIVDFAFRNTDQEIIEIYYSFINKQKDIETCTILYSCIVSLSLKNSSYVVGFYKQLSENQDLKWAKQLAEIYFSNITLTSFDSIDTFFSNNSGSILPSFASSEPMEINL